MFKNLPTGRKLILLCSAFIVAIVVAIYGLVAEKMIAIDFARKELIGTRYLDTLRGAYAAILSEDETRSPVGQLGSSRPAVLDALASAETDSGSILNTADLHRALTATLDELWSMKVDDVNRDALFLTALASTQKLAVRIGDNSNLTLDPDLDSYYLQDIVVNKMPTILSYLGEMRTFSESAATDQLDDKQKVRLLVLDGLLRSAIDAVSSNLASASRLAPDGGAKRVLGSDVEAMVANTSWYLEALRSGTSDNQAQRASTATSNQEYAGAVRQTLDTWRAIQTELDRLLNLRIDALLDKLYSSLLLTGALASLSIAIALMTHRHIVGPLKRLEGIARTVQRSKDYSLRVDYRAHDEIGKLANAFNDMLSELASAREREAVDQARAAAMHTELSRVARLTTMGEMAASIAHEINQPLAAIVANGNAGLRWLAHAAPDLTETRAALTRIVADGHRASKVIKSIRAIFKAERHERTALAPSGLIEEVLTLVHGQLQAQQILVRAELGTELPEVIADRVQLQQVLLNLIMNAAEAMASISDRPRVLLVKSQLHKRDSVSITVVDSGPGIDPQHMERIFEAFFTTKPSGMGMGLSICRSIIEAHGGQLWAAPATPHGSVFHIILPTKMDQE